MNAQEAFTAETRAAGQRIRRLMAELRGKFPIVPQCRAPKEFSKVTQHPSSDLLAFRADVSRLADQIQDEDRARLLEPVGPKHLRGRPPIRRAQTAIISIAAQRAYERRMAQEKYRAALDAMTRRSA